MVRGTDGQVASYTSKIRVNMVFRQFLVRTTIWCMITTILEVVNRGSSFDGDLAAIRLFEICLLKTVAPYLVTVSR